MLERSSVLFVVKQIPTAIVPGPPMQRPLLRHDRHASSTLQLRSLILLHTKPSQSLSLISISPSSSSSSISASLSSLCLLTPCGLATFSSFAAGGANALTF